jgi:hypothetical protein
MFRTSLFILFTTFLFSNEYKTVAENFLKYREISKEIESSITLEKDGVEVGYVFTLLGGGYVVVPISKDISPIKAYSFTSSKISELYRTFLTNDLYALTKMSESLERTLISKVAERWIFLENYSQTLERTDNSNLESDSSNGSTGSATRLTDTDWDQGYPYNLYFPKVGEDTTLTGCVQTALGQVMKYHSHPSYGSGVVRHTGAEILDGSKEVDHTEDMEAILYRNYNWDIMPDTFSGEFSKIQADEVALLMLDLAILNRASIGIAETGAYIKQTLFVKSFGYSTDISSASTKNGDNYADILEIVKAQIDLELPVLFSIPGHMVVADAYESDEVGDFVHLNMGWGGVDNSFYNMSEDIEAGGMAFAQYSDNDIAIIYNVKPCSESAGDCFVNLEVEDSLAEWENRTLESDDTLGEWENSTLEVGDSLGEWRNLTLESGDILEEWRNSTLESGDAFEDTIAGNLANFDDVDEYEIFLSGSSTLSRDSNYWNIALYDMSGNLVSENMTESVSAVVSEGKYKIRISWKSSGGLYYTLSSFSSNYTISISTTAVSEEKQSEIESSVERKLISGNLEDFEDFDEYELLFSEDTTISRSSPYWNIMVYDNTGNLVTENITENITENLSAGIYKVRVSWKTSGGSYYPNMSPYDLNYTISTQTVPAEISSESEKSLLSGNLEDLDDIDKYELYLSGETTIFRNGSSWNMALYDSNGTLILESRTSNISKTLETGRYVIQVSWKSSNGVYSNLSSYNSDYSISVETDEVSTEEKSEIEDSVERELISGNLEDLDDIDKYELYLSGETTLFRNSASWNIALYDINGTLISESRTENISQTLATGKYGVEISWKSSGGVYSSLSSYNSDYSLSVETSSISEERKSEIDNSVERSIITGRLEKFGDIDEYEVYLSGNSILLRDSKYWNMALYDMEGNLISENRIGDIGERDVLTGKYIIQVSWQESSGTYSTLDSFDSNYSISIYTTPTAEIEKSFIDESYEVSPEIGLELKDMVISDSERVLINVYDGNGDEVSLKVKTVSNVVKGKLDENILTLLPKSNGASDVVIEVSAGDDFVEESFTVLSYDDEVGFGTEFQLSGTFPDGISTLSQKAILDGSCTISGYRGYSNQAFFIQVSDVDGVVSSWSDSEISEDFENGLYTIEAKIGGYTFSEDFATYTLSFSCPDGDFSIENIASILEIDLSGKDDTTENIQDYNISIPISKGWNLISNPVDSLFNLDSITNENISRVFAYSSYNWYLWKNSGNVGEFSELSYFEPQIGYWFFGEEETEINLESGNEASCPDGNSLDLGWNLVGSCSGDLETIFSENSSYYIIYTYDNGNWFIAGNSPELNQNIVEYGYELLEDISSSDGFWVYIVE